MGRLQDFAACEDLITHLDSEEEVEVRAAHGALEQITALRLPLSTARWRTWHQRERQWYLERAPILLNGLRNPTEKTVLPALAELARYRYERHRLALAIAPVLQHQDPLFARRACSTLRGLGSPTVVSALVECLGSGDAAFDEVVCATLRSLTDLDLPPKAREWELALAATEGSTGSR